MIDGNGCSANTSVTVANGAGNLNLNTDVTNGECGTLGAIWVDFIGGTPDYTVDWSGPSSGTFTLGGTGWSIMNLASGTYDIIVTDGNG